MTITEFLQYAGSFVGILTAFVVAYLLSAWGPMNKNWDNT